MQLSNRAIEIAREGGAISLEFPRNQQTQRCLNLGEALKRCVLDNNIHILNHPKVRQVCQPDEWRKECTGGWRRYHIEQIYMKQINKELYTQQKLDRLHEWRNNQKHQTFVDSRY